MKRPIYWGVVASIVLLSGSTLLWMTLESKQNKYPLNKDNVYVYSEQGILNWFDFNNQKNKLIGIHHQQKIIEEVGEAPYLEEKKLALIGEQTEKGYKFHINDDGTNKIYEADMDGKGLVVHRKGQKEQQLYHRIEKEELEQYIEDINQQLQLALDQAEEKEKGRINDFFTTLTSVYGYLYTSKDNSLQLFITIDEALREGEISGTMLMTEATGHKFKPYIEKTYRFVGITDGLMIELYTTVDGEQTKLEGNFYHDASSFNLTFWKSDHKLEFHKVTEEKISQNRI